MISTTQSIMKAVHRREQSRLHRPKQVWAGLFFLAIIADWDLFCVASPVKSSGYADAWMMSCIAGLESAEDRSQADPRRELKEYLNATPFMCKDLVAFWGVS